MRPSSYRFQTHSKFKQVPNPQIRKVHCTHSFKSVYGINSGDGPEVSPLSLFLKTCGDVVELFCLMLPDCKQSSITLKPSVSLKKKC